MNVFLLMCFILNVKAWGLSVSEGLAKEEWLTLNSIVSASKLGGVYFAVI